MTKPDDTATGDIREQLERHSSALHIGEGDRSEILRVVDLDKIERLFHSYKQQVLEELSERLPEKQEQVMPHNSKEDYETAHDRFYRVGGYNFALSQVHQVIAEMKEKS